MKKYLFPLMLVVMSSFAHAGLYEERAAKAAARADRIEAQKIKAENEWVEKNFVAAVLLFGRKHSGYAKKPDCRDNSYEKGSFWMGARSACVAGSCITVHGQRNLADNYADNAYGQKFLSYFGSLKDCDVVLKNGLACYLTADYSQNVINGSCLDAAGRESTLTSPMPDLKK